MTEARAVHRRLRRSEFGVVFCGGGPAALGPFVCAARTGRLDELLDRGVLMVERGRRLGGGSLRHYNISSNSVAVAFLEGLDEVPAGGPFDEVSRDETTAEMRRNRSIHVPLKLVGSYLDSLGAAVEGLLENHPACAIARETTVDQLRVEDGAVAITMENGSRETVRAEQAVIAMGGRAPDGIEKLEISPGLTLAPYAQKLRHASALFDQRIGLPPHLIDAVRTSGRVAVVGGSHSAWSIAWILMNDPAFRTDTGTPPTVTLLHRSPVRLFYLTKEEAEADGYLFDPDLDVCPVSGRVNRVAGLKGDARALARRVLGFEENGFPIRLVHLGHRDDAAKVLDEASLVVAATGYRPRLPELVETTGRRLEAEQSAAGLSVTDDAEVVARGGRVLSGVLSYGLGVGIRAPDRIGGEPSNARAITSVWLYQHDLGRVVLRSLIGVDDVEAHGQLPALTPGALGSGF